MFNMIITYGKPKDPDAFLAHYRDVHVPIVAQIPGLIGASYGCCEGVRSKEPAYFMIAIMSFADRASYEEAMAKPEMAATGKDLKNFADGGVTMVACEAVDLDTHRV